jgi:hypothetical protein
MAQEDGATWEDSHVISCAEEHGYDYVVEWARENGCPEPYARPNVILYCWRLAINSFMCKNNNYVDYHYIS